MEKPSFTKEFEFKASQKMLFPYLNTPGGLAQWFADDVTVDEDKVFSFSWDEEVHRARISYQKLNRSIRFEFLAASSDGPADGHDYASFIDIQLENNELTGTVFMVITDNVTSEDHDEALEIWQFMTGNLKEIVGG